ncbi:hypothetical protein M413DRAFT_119557 [Hebeloma cylindrosporum]|uniref:F-box domain-containing protein n=1 Tax=Hebeloma cylindrosporum TaxID=76867 RepID=A0A0C3CFW6_HEBCY|nr:hypothetical protein M413DRAFT_119557 [Hebeloma cylindrosporum h7]
MAIYHRFLSKSSNTLKSLEFFNMPSRVPQSNEAEVQDLDKLFSACPNVEHLHLPIGIHIPQDTLNKIAQGSLLPSLRSLDVFSTVGIDILEMVGRRNELVYRRFGVRSSRLGGAIDGYPLSFAHVVLHTLLANWSSTTSAKRYLRRFWSSQGTVFDIRCRVVYFVG